VSAIPMINGAKVTPSQQNTLRSMVQELSYDAVIAMDLSIGGWNIHDQLSGNGLSKSVKLCVSCGSNYLLSNRINIRFM
jgi:hypothetical protein